MNEKINEEVINHFRPIIGDICNKNNLDLLTPDNYSHYLDLQIDLMQKITELYTRQPFPKDKKVLIITNLKLEPVSMKPNSEEWEKVYISHLTVNDLIYKGDNYNLALACKDKENTSSLIVPYSETTPIVRFPVLMKKGFKHYASPDAYKSFSGLYESLVGRYSTYYK